MKGSKREQSVMSVWREMLMWTGMALGLLED